MDKKSLTEFRELLLKQRQTLQEVSESNADATETVELDQTRQGRLSRMDALQGQAMSIASLNRRKLELKKIEQALVRIDSDEFGYCQACGEQIAQKRLEFNPTVTHCIHCAEKLEANDQE